jgi:hypothetical protein
VEHEKRTAALIPSLRLPPFRMDTPMLAALRSEKGRLVQGFSGTCRRADLWLTVCPSPRLFLELRILKDFKANVFGSADSKAVTRLFRGSADSKGVRCCRTGCARLVLVRGICRSGLRAEGVDNGKRAGRSGLCLEARPWRLPSFLGAGRVNPPRLGVNGRRFDLAHTQKHSI